MTQREPCPYCGSTYSLGMNQVTGVFECQNPPCIFKRPKAASQANSQSKSK